EAGQGGAEARLLRAARDRRPGARPDLPARRLLGERVVRGPHMMPFGAMRAVNLVGDGVIYGSVGAVATDVVRGMLPPAIELLDHPLTPAGTHPVAHFFQKMIGTHMTVPTVLPILDYHEHITGIPFTAPRGAPRSGPCLFIPRLNLDDAVA